MSLKHTEGFVWQGFDQIGGEDGVCNRRDNATEGGNGHVEISVDVGNYVHRVKGPESKRFTVADYNKLWEGVSSIHLQDLFFSLLSSFSLAFCLLNDTEAINFPWKLVNLQLAHIQEESMMRLLCFGICSFWGTYCSSWKCGLRCRSACFRNCVRRQACHRKWWGLGRHTSSSHKFLVQFVAKLWLHEA